MVELRTGCHYWMRIQNFVSVLLTVEESPRLKPTLGAAAMSWWNLERSIITECVHKISCQCCWPLRSPLVGSQPWVQQPCHRTGYHNWMRIQNFVSVLLTVEESPRREPTLGAAAMSWWNLERAIITECVYKISCLCCWPLRSLLVGSQPWVQQPCHGET